MKVRFNDKNDDDSFVFRLKYSYVPRDCFAAVGTARGENASDAEGDASESIPAGKAVIRGFNANFRSEDHHIRNLGLEARGGRVAMFFGDKNGDDTFDWMVKWAVLLPDAG